MIIRELRNDRANKSFREIKEKIGYKKASYVATHMVWPPFSRPAIATKERVDSE